MRQKARIDDNQEAVVEGLRKAGASVAITSSLGKGFPDIVVGFRRRNYLLEIKNPEQPPKKRLLTKDEDIFHMAWTGQISIVETTEEALRTIGAIQ